MNKRILYFIFLLIISKTLSSQIITTIIGNGQAGYSGENVPAINSYLCEPGGVAIDKIGNVYTGNRCVERIMRCDTNGLFSTIAGNGYSNYVDGSGTFTGDGGPAIQAGFYYPQNLFLDYKGNFYVHDYNNHRVRKIDKSGIINTIVFKGNLSALGCDSLGNVFYGTQTQIFKLDTLGNTTLIAGTGTSGIPNEGDSAKHTKLTSITYISLDNTGNIYFVDNGLARKIDINGIVHVVVGYGWGQQYRSSDGLMATDAKINASAIATDNLGNIYITDVNTSSLLKINKYGIIYTIAGDTVPYGGNGIPAIQASLGSVNWDIDVIQLDKKGNIYLALSGAGVIKKITPNTSHGINSQPTTKHTCNGSNTFFNVGASKATFFQWQVNQGLGFSNLVDDSIYNGSNTEILGLKKVGSSMNGYTYRCVVQDSITYISDTAGLFIKALPAIQISATSDNYCFTGGLDTLKAHGGVSYVWNINSTTTQTITSYVTPYVSPLTFTLTGIDASGCKNTTTKTITVFSHTVTITASSTTICAGDSVTLSETNMPSFNWLPNSQTQSSFTSYPPVTITYTLIGQDINSCVDTLTKQISVDTFHVNLSYTLPTGCPSSIVLSAQVTQLNGLVTYNWYNNDTLFGTVSNSGSEIYSYQYGQPLSFSVQAIDGFGCKTSDTAKAPTLLNHCMWQGDTDDNGIVDNTDLLPIGIKYNHTGPSNFSLAYSSFAWQGFFVPNWSNDTLYNGVNAKYSDCDGSGIINGLDTAYILAHYTSTHSLRIKPNKVDTVSSSPDIYFSFNKSAYQPGDILLADIYVGSNSNIQTNFYGLAFIINYDASQVVQGSESFNFNPSWVGTLGSTTISYRHLNNYVGTFALSLVRTNHSDTSGYGKIGTLSLTLNSAAANNMIFSYSNAIKTNSQGNYSGLSSNVDSVSILSSQVGIKQITNSNELFEIYPNPTQDFLNFSGTEIAGKIKIYNQLGSEVFSGTLNSLNGIIDVRSLSSGVYTLMLKNRRILFVKN